MKPSYLTRQRSPWERTVGLDAPLGGIGDWWRRRVGDGTLYACRAEEPMGWHLSVSFRNQRNEHSRYPTWDEIAHARNELLPADVEFVMFFPTEARYVNAHPTTFHLHEFPMREAS